MTLDLAGIGGLGGDQQPGEARDRVGILARGVGDGDAIVGRHLLDAGGRFGYAVDIALHPVAGRVLHVSEGDLVLHGVDQLDVADGAGHLANQAGDTLIAFAADADGPRNREFPSRRRSSSHC